MFKQFLDNASYEEILGTANCLCDACLFQQAKEFLPVLMENERELTLDDQNTINRISKGIADSIRKSWKVIYLAEQKERGKGREDRSTPLLEYRKQLENQMTTFCKEINEKIQKKLLSRTTDTSLRGLLFKMIGDYWRYLSEIQRGYDRRESANKALAAYQEAEDLIVAVSGPASSIRLSLVLNMAIFKFEILSESEEAIDLLKKTYEEGIACVDSLHESAYADSILVLQMIHRTISAWNRNH